MTLLLREAGLHASLPLTTAQARWLGRNGIGVADMVQPGREPGTFDVWVGNLAGTVSGHGLDVVIEPKLPVSSLLWLVGYATCGMRLVPHALAGHSDLTSGFAALFLDVAREAIEPGLLRGYWPLDEQTSALRGRIRMAEQVSRHHGRLYPLEVSHEEHGVDIPENRILRAATGELLRTVGVSSAGTVGVGLRRVYRTLAEAGPLRAGDLSAWRPTRLNSRYHHVLRLCELVLSGRGVEARAGQIETRGFLINTPQVFEAAFARALGEQSDTLLARCRVETQRSLPYVKELLGYRLRPDIVLTRDGVPVAVLDTKYKRAGTGPSREDMYQMVTYALCHGLQDVHLVYAEPLPPELPEVLHVSGAGVRVHLHGVDLGQGSDGFLAQVSALTKKLLTPWRRSAP
ncbi:McrC family protein [Dermabacteraceae bacterium P13115]